MEGREKERGVVGGWGGDDKEENNRDGQIRREGEETKRGDGKNRRGG